jgi:hypothetical protein
MLKWKRVIGGMGCILVSAAAIVLAQGDMGSGGGGGGGAPSSSAGMGNAHGSPSHRSSPTDYYRGKTPPQQASALTPHSGQYLATKANLYELVLTMSQARIYVYDKSLKPQTARNLHVQMSFLAPDEKERRQIPFEYIGTAQGSDQDYVAASFNFTLFQKKSIPLKIEFSELPDHSQTSASFSPVFSTDKVRPYVAQVLLTEADRVGIAHQQACPVCGSQLGSKGLVHKALIAEYPLYVCSKECLTAVRQTPAKYAPQAAAESPNAR